MASVAISDHRDTGAKCEDALAIQLLAQIIMPPPSLTSTGENIFHFPISFGTQVDEFLMLRGVTEGELWSLLQACVHASNIDQFVHHISMRLGHRFNRTDAHFLWTHIKFPCV